MKVVVFGVGLMRVWLIGWLIWCRILNHVFCDWTYAMLCLEYHRDTDLF